MGMGPPEQRQPKEAGVTVGLQDRPALRSAVVADRIDSKELFIRWQEHGEQRARDELETASAHHTASLDAPRDDREEESGTLADAFGQTDERFELVDAKVTIAAAARHLGARERRVLLLRFVEDLTQSQIATLIGVSQMQVSRILRRALEQLRELTQAESEP